MEVNHTGVNIAEQLGEVADAFAIPNYKRVAVVHDNASNMKLCRDAEERTREMGQRSRGLLLRTHATAVHKYSPKTGQNTPHSCGCQESRGTLQKKSKGYSCIERQTKAAECCSAHTHK
ncbi:hypothetical protein KUCAC02_004526 [Chaenocephalus aceratus]|uniref:Uncharacterized protein n=1 Tax=Chaenocephalus aceratus TaxID=36190 RepID=A0ACB9WYX2_CHAAC|nr:hypothetical protein KUCAC02_004526 [Chaenocephalus aceratus]